MIIVNNTISGEGSITVKQVGTVDSVTTDASKAEKESALSVELNGPSVLKDSQAEKAASSSESALREGARAFERFWLLPERHQDNETVVRLRLNGRLGGWLLKDELVQALGLRVGDCISTEVSVLYTSGIIDDDGSTDLFADGDSAVWLIEAAMEAEEAVGLVVDCRVKFSYCRAPVGGREGKMINKASLILLEGLGVVGVDNEPDVNRPPNEYAERVFASLFDA